MRGDLVRGHLETLVLAAVEQGAAHGYAVIEALRERSGGAFVLPEGTIYPVLHRLEEAGLLSSAWSEAAGRKRRLYSLTKMGRSELVDQRQTWKEFSRAVSSVLGGSR